MQKTLVKSLLAGVVASLALHLPLIGLLLALLAAPLMLLAPELGTTGAQVDIGFAWISLKSPFAWIAFSGYFSLLALLFVRIFRFLKAARSNKVG